LPVEKLTPVVPDDGVEFQALIDKAPIQTRESAAYATLLERARETPPEKLASEARRDIFFTHLWERPSAYRGVPIHIEGTAKKVLTHEVGPSMSPKGRLFEVWVYSEENRAFPYVVTIEDAPPGLSIGHELNLRVTIDAYFMKLLGYRAGDHLRAAPMLVGRMHWTPPRPEAPAPMAELREWTKKDGFAILFVLLLGYIFIRAFFQVRKALFQTRPRPGYKAPSEGLPPEEVADWLRNLPDEVSEPEEEEDEPPHRQR
jgi:hypothetical protein